MAKRKSFADDGWAIWITGEDTSTFYLNEWVNPQGKSYVDVAVRIRGVKGTRNLNLYIPFKVDKTEIACVSGGFPSSHTFLEIKTIETALAVKDGATEIDMVLSVGTFLSGDYETCSDEISEIKASCGAAPLKVILETGALLSAEAIKKASVLSMYAGADFIKTSTGKISIAATPEAAYVMCKAIKEYKAQTGRWVGFKAAGGIKTVDDAVAYYTIVRELLGQEFIDKNLFRIGTSSLANKLVNEILGEEVNPF